MQHYGISKKTSLSFDEAVEKVSGLLLQEGFGLITKIDFQAKIKEKLGKDVERYLILGACNPASAFEAIQGEIEIGLLLPCNVIVYEKEGKVFVSAVRPSVAMGFVNNPKITPVAERVEKSLKNVIEQV